MTAFETASRDRFIQKLCGLIRSEHAELATDMSNPDLHTAMTDAMKVAQEYRLVVEADVFEFAVLRLLFGPDWPRGPEHRWAHDILRHVAEAPDVRLFQIRWHLELEAEKAQGA